MTTITHPTFVVRSYLSGPIEVAKQVLREFCREVPSCATIEPTTFIYPGGEEVGYVVGMLQYPKFPLPEAEIRDRAVDLANLLIERTFQDSALVVTSSETLWMTRRK